MKKSHVNLFFTASVVVLFLLSSGVSGFARVNHSSMGNSVRNNDSSVQTDACITCYANGKPFAQIVSYESGMILKDLFLRLVEANACDPVSVETLKLQEQILWYADEQGLLPSGVTVDGVLSQIHQAEVLGAQHPICANPIGYEGSGREFFCNFVSTGEGSAYPIIILPRLIPILMTPIPRLFVGWNTVNGLTSVGGLRSHTGFIASGAQEGLALGFWGIGFSIFLPPIMSYGMFGYALYAKVSAEEMEYWPPNNPPEVTAVYPLDGATYVPLSTSELQFHIGDLDGDLMSYSVTTSPDVGGGNGNLKPDGTYSVPISDLQSSTEYTWHVTISDGKDTIEETFSFTTEAVAPIISEVVPFDGDRYVLVTQESLGFYLRDPQGDLMSYTVETSPDIGSENGNDVNNGYMSIPISGLDYMTEYWWFVNATDGTHTTSEVFYFRTGPVMIFDPFLEGWQYHKTITIDHTKIVDDFQNFTILIHIFDQDIREKAKEDGDDILFMNDQGIATRVFHEIERYDSSTGELVVWVKIPFLSSQLNTVLFMYYGNQNCASQQHPMATWDSSYVMVQHMNNQDIQYDSTSYQNNGNPINNPTSRLNGFIGYAVDFEKDAHQYINCGHDASLNIGGSALTLEAWYNLESIGDGSTYNRYRHLLAKWDYQYDDDRCYTITIRDNNARCTLTHNGLKETVASWAGIHTGLWYYHVGLLSGNDLALFINGELKIVQNHVGGIFQSPYADVLIGNNNQGLNVESFDGLIDEIRISNIPRTNAWIATTYDNINDPSDFSFVGPEVPGP
jgi:hypothetical protein